eukprot:jgi/Botrbrau1/12157/Bobra.0186s0068.1
MSEPDPTKKSLANTVTQCDLVKRALHLHEIMSKFPSMTDREIMRDFLNDPRITDTLQQTASDLKKFVSKVAKMHQTFEKQLVNPLQTTGYGDLEVGQTLFGSVHICRELNHDMCLVVVHVSNVSHGDHMKSQAYPARLCCQAIRVDILGRAELF